MCTNEQIKLEYQDMQMGRKHKVKREMHIEKKNHKEEVGQMRMRSNMLMYPNHFMNTILLFNFWSMIS